MPSIKQLQERLAYHEQRAAALRLVIGELNGHAAAQAQNALPQRFKQAVALRRAATNGYASRRRAWPRSGVTLKVKAQRAKSLKFLNLFHEEQPRPLPPKTLGQMVGVFIRRGYLKKAGEGLYLRTAKPFHIAQRG